MDAGSTGTRIFVYEWDTPSSCHDSPYIRPSYFTSGPKKDKQFKLKKKGGLAEIAPELVPGYLEDFLTEAIQFIPKEKLANTPIFLKATAGMRLLPHFKANAILSQVRKVFSESPFMYDPKFGVQIIPGEYEGVFGWLTVNYLAGVLGTKDKPSVGMVDMGGASCQITFETPQVPMENAFPINLNGTSRVVYTHSYLRFGRNEARERYQVRHLKASDVELPEDPCFVRGFRGVSPSGLEFVGSGDFKSCISKTEHLTLKDPFCPTSSCAINGVYQPTIPENMEVVGIAGMFKVAKWFKCHGRSSIRRLRDHAEEVCSNLDIDAYTEKFSKHSDDSDFNNYCFMAAYIVNMLETGYGLPLDRTIRFASSVRGADVGWTLGAMIYEANLLYPSGQCCK
ncbi:Guanosine-diphosphatase [Entomophthora muscae]|uniref:Guanosine-diphosphatase n=1 Tax=Entomophthora muscae TaxID=34485 RepID=A0ACC2SZD3_9FUNG|nr:Guanosine-diphosphatase [Entomophthora muscae]